MPEIQSRSFGDMFMSFLKFLVLALLIVTPFRFYVAQPFIVSGASMEPSLNNGEYLVIDELSYEMRSPTRGEIIIMRYPLDASLFYIKRVIGLPGETISIRDGKVYILGADGKTNTELNEPYLKSAMLPTKPELTRLSDDEYYVLGDNRNASSDSRVWGPLSKKFIVGRPLLRLFPFNEIAYLPGEHELSD